MSSDRKAKRSPNSGGANGSAHKDADAYAAQITASWQKAVKSILETGRLLIEAKKRLPHGEWQHMFLTPGHSGVMPGKVPFGTRTAQMLMLIAKHPVLSNAKYISLLPASWGTLYELTQLPPGELQDMVNRGVIHPEIRRSDVKTLGFELCDRVPVALDTLVTFMQRWKTDELAEHVVGRIYVDGNLSYLDLLLPAWITELSAACKRVAMRETAQTKEEVEEDQRSEAREVAAGEKDLLERRKRRIKRRVKKRLREKPMEEDERRVMQ